MNYSKLNDKTIVLICARGGSKGIKDKNLLKIKKKSLLAITIDKIKKLKFKNICLSTDSSKIMVEAKKNGVKCFFKRSKKLSGQDISKLNVWKDSIKRSELYFKKKFTFMLDIDVSNPLADHKDLKKFTELFIKKYKNCDGMFCASKSWKNPYFNILEKKNNKFIVSKSSKRIISRQKAPVTFDHIAAFYFFKVKYIYKTNFLFNGKLEKYDLPFWKSIDIDDKDDYEMVKKLAQ
jgi:CMP-N,N'-diacetyllegionaminic acid synthase